MTSSEHAGVFPAIPVRLSDQQTSPAGLNLGLSARYRGRYLQFTLTTLLSGRQGKSKLTLLETGLMSNNVLVKDYAARLDRPWYRRNPKTSPLSKKPRRGAVWRHEWFFVVAKARTLMMLITSVTRRAQTARLLWQNDDPGPRCLLERHVSEIPFDNLIVAQAGAA